MIYPDVLVMGVGRSGTSSTAKLLHYNLGVCMGQRYDWIGAHYSVPMDNRPHPYGTFESDMMNKPTRRMVNRVQQETAIEADKRERDTTRNWIVEWLDTYKKLHKDCPVKYHGVKNTQLSLCNVKQLQALHPLLVVRTYRPKELVIDSLIRWRSHRYDTREHWSVFYDEREGSMNRLENESGIPFVTVDFSTKLTDDDIINVLKPALAKYIKGGQNVR